MKKTIHLDTLEGLPEGFLEKLSEVRPILEQHIYLDRISEEIPELSELMREIDAYCMGHYIKAYHYTRANEKDIRQNGLLCRTGEEIRKQFLSEHSNLFNRQELEKVKLVWEKFFGEHQKRSRDQRVFFNVTKAAMKDRSAQPLLQYYGGEQVHMPLNEFPEILNKLSGAGTPLIVSFRVKASEATYYGPLYPYGLVAMSTYHRLVQPKAHIHDFDAQISNAVSPEDIIDIIQA